MSADLAKSAVEWFRAVGAGTGAFVVRLFRPLMDNGLVREALAKTCAKFKTIDSVGPVRAAQIVQASGGDYAPTRHDAFERATALFAALGVISD